LIGIGLVDEEAVPTNFAAMDHGMAAVASFEPQPPFTTLKLLSVTFQCTEASIALF